MLFSNHYDFSFIDYIEKLKKDEEKKELIEELQMFLEDIFSTEVENKYNYLLNSKDVGEAESIIYELNKTHDTIEKILFPIFKIDFSYLTNHNWESIAINNSIEIKHVNEEEAFNIHDDDWEDLKDVNYNSGVYYYNTYPDDLPF
ncbi:hypothetical protein D3C86_1623290 [compost metagenome]